MTTDNIDTEERRRFNVWVDAVVRRNPAGVSDAWINAAWAGWKMRTGILEAYTQSAAPPAEGTQSYDNFLVQLEKDWMAQSEHLSYTNYLKRRLFAAQPAQQWISDAAKEILDQEHAPKGNWGECWQTFSRETKHKIISQIIKKYAKYVLPDPPEGGR